MTKVFQHIPNFISGVDPIKTEVDSLEELLALEFVSRWKTNERFRQFTEWDDKLMADMDDGSFWVLARIDPKDILAALPGCQGKKQ